MARLPDSLPQDAVQGPGLPIEGLPATDLGFGQAADTAERVAGQERRTRIYEQRAQDKADAQTVKPDVLKLYSANADQLATDGPKWNGQPGFASDQVQQYTARAAAAAQNPAYTPGQRAAFQKAADQVTESAGMAAVQHEAGVIRQNAVDAQEVQQNGAIAGFLQDYSAAKQPILDAYDGSQANLVPSVQQTFDAHASAALSAAPDNMKPALSAQFGRMRVQETADALALQAKGHDAFVLGNAEKQAGGLIDTIVSNPSAYDSVVRDGLPGIIATTPGGYRQKVQTDLMAAAATARVKGLIQAQTPQVALSELSDGRYDGMLQPEQKEALVAQAAAEDRAHGPDAISRAMAGQDLAQRMSADIYARASTGHATGVDMDALAATLSGEISPQALAEYRQRATAADQAFAVTGPVRAMNNGQLAGVRGEPPPDPSDPNYAHGLPVWQARQEAAAEELKRRQTDPAAWAFDSSGAPKTGAKAGGSGAAVDRGAVLQQSYTSWISAADPASRLAAGGHLAGQSLGAQAAAGIAPTAWNLIPQAQAAQLAAGVINATPEQRLAALQRVGGLLSGLPASFPMPDGTVAAPRAVLARQLAAAHMTPIELSAAVDYGDNPAALGRVTAALNDPTLKKPLDRPGEARALQTQARAALAPFLTAAMPLPGQTALEQARIDRTVLTARELMATHGMSQGDAVRSAAADLLGPYTYVDTWRAPQGAGPTSIIQGGAQTVLGKLTQSQNFMAPTGVPPGVVAAQVHQFGRWTSRPDDSGLMLTVPKADGGWSQVLDKFGRPISLNWQQLQNGTDGMRPTPFDHPPPTALHGPDGAPVPAFSRQQMFGALSWAVNGQESHFKSGLVSPKGALGQMQLMPDTVATYAPRLGLPVDLGRAQHDDAYNRQIGNAALSDHVQKYGPGAGIGLALAAYNWGPGNVDKALRLYGDPRTGQTSLTQWVGHLPPETQAYVKAVMPAALGRLQGRF